MDALTHFLKLASVVDFRGHQNHAGSRGSMARLCTELPNQSGSPFLPTQATVHANSCCISAAGAAGSVHVPHNNRCPWAHTAAVRGAGAPCPFPTWAGRAMSTGVPQTAQPAFFTSSFNVTKALYRTDEHGKGKQQRPLGDSIHPSAMHLPLSWQSSSLLQVVWQRPLLQPEQLQPQEGLQLTWRSAAVM